MPLLLGEYRKRMLAEVRAYRLRDLRERLDLTQDEVAAQLAVSQRRVSRIEHGDIERTQVDTRDRQAAEPDLLHDPLPDQGAAEAVAAEDLVDVVGSETSGSQCSKHGRRGQARIARVGLVLVVMTLVAGCGNCGDESSGGSVNRPS